MNPFDLQVADGIGWLTFNDLNEKVNKLTAKNLEALSDHLAAIRTRSDIQILIVISGKPDVFIAGADINEIRSITDSEDGRAKSEMGQRILGQLATLPFPTIAAIHGAALGGGLELALACTYRVVSDHPKTQLGLPEVNLGIIPGFGGTARLPRLIRLQDAAMMIVTGGSVSGPKAEKSGLADRCVSDGFFKEGVLAFAKFGLTEGGRRAILAGRRNRRSLIDRIPFGAALVLAMAHKSVLLKTAGRYPAPLAAIASIKNGRGRSIDAALAIESRYFSELVVTPVSKNLIGLYFITELLKKTRVLCPQSLCSRFIRRRCWVRG